VVPAAQQKLTSAKKICSAVQQFANLYQHYEPLHFPSVVPTPSGRRKQMAATKSGGSKRGFAAMDPAKQREIASKGGKASHGGGRKAASSR
jgi:hypothetical protein